MTRCTVRPARMESKRGVHSVPSAVTSATFSTQLSASCAPPAPSASVESCGEKGAAMRRAREL